MIVTIKKDLPNLNAEFKIAQKKSGKSFTQICEEAKISREYLYAVLRNEKAISCGQLLKLQQVLNFTFETLQQFL